ncbi:hypothetical protein EYF80_030653 [Liparis tanakae]|uniref:Uncharacterized protein n=1 Tax=Liparis tanakae TaxID=230148 RepID=A0A4Z2H039_9TELE|nr:hypothetical protein EYF80_030653 [Liparis tanakae]
MGVNSAFVWDYFQQRANDRALIHGGGTDRDSAAGLPGLLALEADAAEAPPGAPAAGPTPPASAPSRPALDALSRGRSFGLSAGSLGGFIWSKAASGFALDCNWRREDENKSSDEAARPLETREGGPVYATLMWVPSEDMRLGRVEAGDVGPWWEKEDEEEG